MEESDSSRKKESQSFGERESFILFMWNFGGGDAIKKPSAFTFQPLWREIIP